MRIVFMGTPAFSVPVLDALVAAGHEIAVVYSQPPRPAGRGKKDRPGPVHARALELGIDVRTPVSLKDVQAQRAFAALGADVAVVVAYGLILPQAVLDAPRHGCLNIHASLLPRWRGAAPIHRAVMAGDAQTGVCIMQMDAGLDTGPVLLRAALEIGAQETTAQLHDRLSALGAGLIVEALGRLDALVPQVQLEAGVSYAAKIDKAEARIDWTRPAVEVDRMIRGLSPFPGAWFELDGVRVKVLGARAVAGAGAPGVVLEGAPGVVLEGAPGVVLDGALCVACGQGAVALTRLQKAGKGAQDADVFQRGAQIAPGTDLSKG